MPYASQGKYRVCLLSAFILIPVLGAADMHAFGRAAHEEI